MTNDHFLFFSSYTCIIKETKEETVPEAITAFLEGEDFEDVIRTAVSLGGDCGLLR